MKIIVCLDDRGGMCFNKRRQSRDRVLLADVKEMTENARVLCSPFSEKLLTEAQIRTEADADFLSRAEAGDFCFVEVDSPVTHLDRAEEIIIYKWNRSYPYDMTFGISPLECGFSLSEVHEFAGSSHEKITKEIYRR